MTSPLFVAETKETQAIRINHPGSPDCMEVVTLQKPPVSAEQALVRLSFSGVNFVDIAMRKGIIKAEPPFSLGMEGVGIVEVVGKNVTEVAPGDRVGYVMVRGTYAQYAAVPASQLVPLPKDVDFADAAAVLLQGMTAHYLTHSTYVLKAGETCLVHAAAGGLGGLLVQMAKMVGARVVATVSTAEKAQAAQGFGADETIIYTEQDFASEVRARTGGHGVDVVYDSVGAATFDKSLNSLRTRGMLVLLGQTSGPVPPLDPAVLSAKGSLFLTRPTLSHYLLNREELLKRAGDVLAWTASGKLRPHIYKTYSLSEVAQAHQDFEDRKTIGKLLIKVM